MRSSLLCRWFVPAAACLWLLPAELAADEIRLADGRVIVGEVARKGDNLEITTRTGVVVVAASEVTSRRTTAELRKHLAKLAESREKDAFTHLQLARTALSYGLEREMWEHLDACLEQLGDGDGAVSRQADAFLATLEPEVVPAHAREADTKTRMRALVRQVRGRIGPGKRAAILTFLVREQDADEVLQLLAKAEPLPEQRLAATEALQRRGAQNDSVVHQRMIWDKEKSVREATADLVVQHGEPKAAVRELAPGLLHDSPAIRIRTAEAYSALGTPEAVALLTMAGPVAGAPANGGGFGTRAHMMQTTDRSYIRDFDVEIAQAAAVANPVVGVVRSGVVLDVNVPAVVTQRVEIENAYRRALKNLVGSDPGADAKTWKNWLERNAPETAKLIPQE